MCWKKQKFHIALKNWKHLDNIKMEIMDLIKDDKKKLKRTVKFTKRNPEQEEDPKTQKSCFSILILFQVD